MPEFPAAHARLGNIRFLTGDHQRAEVAYRQALALAPADPQSHLNPGATLQVLGRPAEARARAKLAAARRVPRR